jgi:hypothetical protein
VAFILPGLSLAAGVAVNFQSEAVVQNINAEDMCNMPLGGRNRYPNRDKYVIATLYCH